MITERFTDRARIIMQLANQEAQRFNYEYVGTEHVLLGMVKEGSGVAAHVLITILGDVPDGESGLDHRSKVLGLIRREVEKLVQVMPDVTSTGKLPLTPKVKELLEKAEVASARLGHNYIGTEHLLLGMLAQEDTTAVKVLKALGVSLCEVERETLSLVGQPAEESESTPTGLPDPQPAFPGIFQRFLTSIELPTGALLGWCVSMLSIKSEDGSIVETPHRPRGTVVGIALKDGEFTFDIRFDDGTVAKGQQSSAFVVEM